MSAAKAALPPNVVAACAGAFIPVSTFMMGLRVYARRHQKIAFGSDDWVMVPAYVLLMGMCITMLIELDRHLIGYRTPHFVPGKPSAAANLPSWPFELQQIPMLGLLKISIVLFYRRIFNTGSTPVQHWSTLIMIVLVAGWTISYFFAFLFICGGRPGSYWESAKVEKESCVQVAPLHLSYAVTDTIFDFLILIMAIPMIWGLRMRIARKFAVTGIFGLGTITVAASITRLVIFAQVATLRFDPFLDFELTITAVMYWSLLEAGLGFLAANLVIAYILLVRWAKMLGLGTIRSYFGSRNRQHSYGSDSYAQKPSLSKNMSEHVRSTDHHHTGSFSGPVYPDTALRYQESFRPTNHTDIYSEPSPSRVRPPHIVQGGIPKYMEKDIEQLYPHDRHIHTQTAIEVRRNDPQAGSRV